MKIKMAIVQFQTTKWQPEINIPRMENFISQAAAQGAQVVLFPEDCVTGPMLKNEAMLCRDGQRVKIFQQMAAKYKVDLIPGSWMEEENQHWYNTTYYIDHSGQIISRYSKIHLWLSERSYLTPGNELSVFETRFGKAGLVICWDLMFPEMFRSMAKQGVQLIYCPSNWDLVLGQKAKQHHPEAERNHVNALCAARALESDLVLAYANLAGPDLIGISQLATPFYGAQAKLNHNKEAILFHEVDLQILQDAELSYQTRADLITESR